jgi:AsnC-type helix-turn-helix domain
MTEIIADARVAADLDVVDRRLLHALGINGRASFRLIASVIGASEQTVARRYRRLREEGVVRVLMLRPLIQPTAGSWCVSRCSPKQYEQSPMHWLAGLMCRGCG